MIRFRGKSVVLYREDDVVDLTETQARAHYVAQVVGSVIGRVEEEFFANVGYALEDICLRDARINGSVVVWHAASFRGHKLYLAFNPMQGVFPVKIVSPTGDVAYCDREWSEVWQYFDEVTHG